MDPGAKATRVRPGNRLQIDHGAVHNQVASLNQLNSHLLRKERVFKVGAVIYSRRKQNNLHVIAVTWRDATENAGQVNRVVVYWKHLLSLESIRESACHNLAVFKYVSDAAGGADVILKHQKLPRLGITHQVNAGNMGVDAPRHIHAYHLPFKMDARIYQRSGHLTVLQDALRAVYVL